MTSQRSANAGRRPLVIIGAGIAGLAAAARLVAAGRKVIVLERHDHPGGRIRTLPSDAGPVDAGPTVLTLRHILDDVFECLDERLDDHVELIRQPLIARHFWADGGQLDLHDCQDRSAAAIHDFAGGRAADQFLAFCRRAKALFSAFEGPVMQARAPRLPGLMRAVAARPSHLLRMAPLSSLASLLGRQFDDPRLAQLFGRYATYVGGSPYLSPALMSLIWQAECDGVWAVRGGVHRLARAIADIATARGADIRYNAHVARIKTSNGQVSGIVLEDGTQVLTDCILFNGDPRALALGALGPDCTDVAPRTRDIARSLSAEVWSFAATPSGPDLAHHNVFFRKTPKPEFDALDRGHLVDDPTLYVCAMDRYAPEPPPNLERFEIIANAPPLTTRPVSPDDKEFDRCQTRTFQTLARFGLRFTPTPRADSLTTPQDFEALFPMTAGSLYGQSPHGMMAAFRRPTARTKVGGLYLAGGGTHPGAGVPMAALSARHAVAAILSDRTSISPCRPTDTPGGISTASTTTRPARSASSGS